MIDFEDRDIQNTGISMLKKQIHKHIYDTNEHGDHTMWETRQQVQPVVSFLVTQVMMIFKSLDDDDSCYCFRNALILGYYEQTPWSATMDRCDWRVVGEAASDDSTTADTGC
jgi:hypothetical protein